MLPLFIVEIADNEQRIFMEKLYVRFYSPMISTVCLILSDKDYAEEVVQETFFRLIKHADMVMNIDMSKPPYFLMAVARNTAVDMQRKLTRNGLICHSAWTKIPPQMLFLILYLCLRKFIFVRNFIKKWAIVFHSLVSMISFYLKQNIF